MVPVVCGGVLATVPGMHNSPAVLPTVDIIQQRGKVFDFILHVGVAGPGPLRLVKLARKTG